MAIKADYINSAPNLKEISDLLVYLHKTYP